MVILLTDGVNNVGDIDPLQAADLAASRNGIKVYAIGAGKTGYAPVPGPDRAGGRTVLRNASYVEIDKRTLQAVAERTGGRYFHATNAEGLIRSRGRRSTQLERSEITEIRYLEYSRSTTRVSSPQHFSSMASSTLLGGTFLRRLP